MSELHFVSFGRFPRVLTTAVAGRTGYTPQTPQRNEVKGENASEQSQRHAHPEAGLSCMETVMTETIRIEWPRFRAFPFIEAANAPNLAVAWDFSAHRLRAIEETLGAASAHVACVAVSGSLNRMEGHSGSDLDLLVVLDDRTHAATTREREAVFTDVWIQLASSPQIPKLKAAKPGGVFSTAASWNAMTDLDNRGVVDEDILTFGQRMQLLLDAQPVFGDAAFEELRRDLLLWYQETRVSSWFQESGPFHWLWQDVQRYWRSLRSRACWLHAAEPQKALEVNLKLRSSRLVLIAGFLQAIAVAQSQTNAPALELLERQLRWSPLERLNAALSTSEQRAALVSSYDIIWEHVAKSCKASESIPANVHTALQQLRLCLNNLPNENSDWLF